MNGEAQPVLPFLYRVNDVRGTQFLPKCRVSETGAFSALRDIPKLDLSKPLFDQADGARKNTILRSYSGLLPVGY